MNRIWMTSEQQELLIPRLDTWVKLSRDVTARGTGVINRNWVMARWHALKCKCVPAHGELLAAIRLDMEISVCIGFGHRFRMPKDYSDYCDTTPRYNRRYYAGINLNESNYKPERWMEACKRELLNVCMFCVKYALSFCYLIEAASRDSSQLILIKVYVVLAKEYIIEFNYA